MGWRIWCLDPVCSQLQPPMIGHESGHGGFPTVPSIFGGCGEGLSDDLMGFLPGSKKLKSKTEN
jgi:hypothetical protein